ncbi:hypothetical protein ACWKWU_17140 [Chitinophaga lutea]
MKRLLTALLLCLSSEAAMAQLTYNNSAESWSKFVLQPSEDQIPRASDTCLVFVSNRFIHPDSLRFVDEFVDTARLKYFFLEKTQGRWQVFQHATLSEAMEHMPPGRDIVVYAEGMGKIFTANVQRAYLMSKQYGVNVVMFDYASTNTTYKPSKNFKFARANARLSSGQYLQLLKALQEARRNGEPWIANAKLTTFNHSMGNIILEQMVKLHDISGINSEPFIDNMVINAACVPQKNHEDWVEKIRFAKQIYVHYNRTDLQLKGAHVLMLRRQLGEKPGKRGRADNVVYVNFHDVAGWQHSYFMNFPYNEYRLTPAMISYFSKLFNGQGISSQEVTSLLVSSGKEKDNAHF